MPFDVWDQAANTETIRRSMETLFEQAPYLGAQIAPLVPVRDRKIKKRTWTIEAFGKGQFKARGATPPLYKPRISVTDEYIELAFLEEMTPIEEDEWHDLTSPDEYVRDRAGIDILTRARILQLRNERLTEWMRWLAFKDALQITLADSQGSYQIVYGIPADQHVTPIVPWTTRTTSTPITDIRTWQRKMNRSLGVFATNVHMNSNTYEELEYSKEAHDLIVGDNNPQPHIPTRPEIEGRLYGGQSDERSGIPPSRIIISDAAFRDEGADYDDRGEDSATYYLGDGEVLLTAPYQVEGENIADVADGRVAVSTAFNELEWRQGMQSEPIVDHESKGYKWRQASARIPRINRPKAFIDAFVF